MQVSHFIHTCMYIIVYTYVCRYYKVARADDLVNDTVSLTVRLQDGRNDSDSVKLLVEGMYVYVLYCRMPIALMCHWCEPEKTIDVYGSSVHIYVYYTSTEVT